MNKLGILTLSSSLILGSALPTSVLAAESITMTQSVAASQQTTGEEAINKEDLIERIHELFPGRFDHLSEQDFHLSFFSPGPYPGIDDDTPRYSINFFKEINRNNYLNGDFQFTGEELELTQFYFSNDNQQEALYPPEVSKEEAEKIASDFLKQLGLDGKYQINNENDLYLYQINRPLTEPIEYRFHYDMLKNNIPVQGQSIQITILGNGDITQFYKQPLSAEITFTDTENIISTDAALEKWQKSIDLQLMYYVKHDYYENSSQAYATYAPSVVPQGIDAASGKYKINGELVEELSSQSNELKVLSEQAKEPTPISKDEAKEIAKTLLEPKDDDTKLTIEGIMETKLPEGTDVYEVRYMLHQGNSGTGSSIQFNKESGELMNFHKPYRFNEEDKESGSEISYDRALEKASEYIEKYAYTKINKVSYPVSSTNEAPYVIGNDQEYNFYFPRVKDGILVQGNGIHVSIDKEDGTLASLNINFNEIEEWPNLQDVVNKEKAIQAYNEKLELELKYVSDHLFEKQRENKPIVFEPIYVQDENFYNEFYNAKSGTWESSLPERIAGEKENNDDNSTIKHPWAEEELNYMIEANIIDLEPSETINPDEPITKGDALEVLVKSIDHMYSRPPMPNEKVQSPFENISPEHELFAVVKRAVDLELIDTKNSTFPINSALTREELADWYARALHLIEIASKPDVFKYPFTDASEIEDQYKGAVALVNALGIMTGNGKAFHPKDEVTLAQLAVSNVRLANMMVKMDMNQRY